MQKPKGTKDIYGSNANLHNLTTNLLEEIVKLFNFSKIETPIFEFKDVFSKTVGQTSEIVSKEMFEFTDKSQRNLVLRPEGTASIMRAVAENKMYAKSLPLKLYYLGPMFRYENPQKGRQRQFTQFGVEIIGAKSPFLDAEVILCATTILKSLGLKYKLKINSLADLKTRKEWFKALTLYFSKFENQLSKTSIKRIKENPMRILDDKVDGKKDFVLSSPKINQFYSQDTKNYFQTLLSFLKVMDIKYEVDYNLVRGLDYYTDTTFEFLPVDSSTSSQSTFIGGGRYDNLLSQFGGPNLSGVGFAIGLERLISNLPPEIVSQSENNEQLSVFVLNLDDQVTKAALAIVYMLRQANIKTDWNFQPTKISKAFDKGAKLGAQIFIIVGPKDIVNNQVVVKFQSKQKLVKIDDLVQYTTSLMKESDEKN